MDAKLPATGQVASSVESLLEILWRDYTRSTPQAERIHALLSARGEQVHNDHIALRTVDLAGLGIDAIARPFIALGWQPREDYRFSDKHLCARYWQHPDPAVPKVFISELIASELPSRAQELLQQLLTQLPDGFAHRSDLAWCGRPWQLDSAIYRELLTMSEYAAWVAAFGWRVNHFTVAVDRLRTFADLAAVNQFVMENGFSLNTAGGAIKGSPADLLEQSSTLADRIDVEFTDGVYRVPSCYYEFARRYRDAHGQVFHGFVPASANRLFESTDAR